MLSDSVLLHFQHTVKVILQLPCWQNTFYKQKGGSYMPVFNIQYSMQIFIRLTHTQTEQSVIIRLSCPHLVSFLSSLFIGIKIRLWPDILLIGVVSCWRTTDLDEISHPVKSDSRQCTNDKAPRASSHDAWCLQQNRFNRATQQMLLSAWIKIHLFVKEVFFNWSFIYLFSHPSGKQKII